MFLDVFGREFREEKRGNMSRKVLQNAQNPSFFIFILFYLESGGLGGKIDFWEGNSNFDP